MHNPAHPGEVLKELYLEPLGLTVTETARKLGVSRKTLSQLAITDPPAFDEVFNQVKEALAA